MRNGKDEKLLCVPDYDPAWKKATDITDVLRACSTASATSSLSIKTSMKESG